MVWVVSRFSLKVETSFTRSHESINNDWIDERDLLAGGDLTTIVSQLAHQLIEYLVLWLLITREKKKSTLYTLECNQQDATFYNNLLFLSMLCSTCFRRGFRTSSGAHKTLNTASGIVELFCRLLLAVGSRKARQYPMLCLQFYELLMMCGKTAWNM
jgi:hypothetical protein